MRHSRFLVWPGLALAWAGYWAPWIAPRAAALQANGYDLGEWITRLPEVRDGSLRLGRLDFLLPLAALCLLAALAAGRAPRAAPWVRWFLRALAGLGALLILPEYPFILTAHADPELRPALILGVVTLLGVAVLALFDAAGRALNAGVDARLPGAAYILLALLALGWTARALLLAWPSLARLFAAAPGLNWGPLVLGVGTAMLAAHGLGRFLARA